MVTISEVWKRGLGLVWRPLAGPYPHSRTRLATWIAVCAGSTGLLGYAASRGPHHVAITALFCLLCVAAETFRVELDQGVELSAVDVFFVVAALAMPLQDASIILLVAAGWAMLRQRSSLQTTFIAGGYMFLGIGGAALIARALSDALAAHSSSGLLAVVTVATMYLSMRAIELIVFALDRLLLLGIRSTWTARWEAIRKGGTAMVSTLPMQILAQAPLSLIGLLAYGVHQWSVLLLLVPFYVTWRNGQQASKLMEAERKMGIDAHTGLVNRGRFFDLASDEIAAARKYGHSVALVMGDLDNFKRVNDTLGHITGDEVLRRTADAMRAAMEGTEAMVARYGGEEFVLLLPATNRHAVVALAEKVRAGVEAALAEFDTSISLGIAYRQDSDRLESLVDRADKALYAAKYAGKNQVHEWNHGASNPVATRAA